MKKTLILFATIIMVYSCSSTKKISGKGFVYKSQNRQLSLSFENDSLCSLKNVFYCDDIDNKYKEIIIKATYKIQSDMIIIRNINCKGFTCEYAPNMDIPIQQSNNCVFLNKESRTGKAVFDGRTYQSDYHKFGLVPNIDIDTLYIIKDEITFVKKIDRGSFGFVFKKVN